MKQFMVSISSSGFSSIQQDVHLLNYDPFTIKKEHEDSACHFWVLFIDRL